ncbi:MAG: hypothetical protein LUO80_01375 [Methylococcaceae bacterium]|nr:hypothetical protein [Methylococcaceae bacterium]
MKAIAGKHAPASSLAKIEASICTMVLNLTADLPMKDRHQCFLDIFPRVTGNQACALPRN